ncbi:MAG: hypothetical protein RL260_1660, partial [Pseudomonadota bacterium]
MNAGLATVTASKRSAAASRSCSRCVTEGATDEITPSEAATTAKCPRSR